MCVCFGCVFLVVEGVDEKKNAAAVEGVCDSVRCVLKCDVCAPQCGDSQCERQGRLLLRASHKLQLSLATAPSG